jgi:hypothetical protein
MLTAVIAFLAGVLLAPVIRPFLRPLFVELIRATLMTVDEVQKMTSHVRESIDDATAEAKADRDAKAARAADASRAAPPADSAPPTAPAA